MIVLSVIGIGLASYLTYIHYSNSQVICTSDACELVQTSVYSKLAGIPVALLGLIGYIGIFVSLVAPEREQTRLATLGLTAIGFGFSAYLTSREAVLAASDLRVVREQRNDHDDPDAALDLPLPHRRLDTRRCALRRGRRPGAPARRRRRAGRRRLAALSPAQLRERAAWLQSGRQGLSSICPLRPDWPAQAAN